MALTENSSHPKWLHYFASLNSTNNYAMQYIDDGMAEHGDVIWAQRQTRGKGQRGKPWVDARGNLKMSLIIKPQIDASQQFILSMLVANVVSQLINEEINGALPVTIKWPNDLFIGDKKACGILIENVFRGMQWTYAILGIGLNLNQTHFPDNLPHATSLSSVSGKTFDQQQWIHELRAGILNQLQAGLKPRDIVTTYNAHLYKRNRSVPFRDLTTGEAFEAFVVEATEKGTLLLLTPQGIRPFQYGSLEWILSPAAG